MPQSALTRATAAEFFQRLGALTRQANHFDGHPESEQQLMAGALALEAWMHNQQPPEPTTPAETYEQQFAAAARAALGRPRQRSAESPLQSLLSLAIARFNERLEKAEDWRTQAALLAKAGATIATTDLVFLPPGQGRVLPAQSDTPQAWEPPATQPRLAWLLAALREWQLELDDLRLEFGQLQPGQMRHAPYVLLTIPRLGKQIAVCDAVDEATFVCASQLPPSFWGGVRKEDLAQYPDMMRVVFGTSGKAEWLARVRAALLAAGPLPPKAKPTALQQPRYQKPKLSVELILSWADAHYAEFKRWPKKNDTDMPQAKSVTGEESWAAINAALFREQRGLQGRSSDETTLAELLEKHRGVRNHKNLAPLTIAQILVWADAHYDEFKRWPKATDQDMPAAMCMAGEVSWRAIDSALKTEYRGLMGLLPDERSLAKLLEKHREVRNDKNLPPLTIAQILVWADAHYAEFKWWPTRADKDMPAAMHEAGEANWMAIESALRLELRGLTGLPADERSLAKLLAKHRGVRNDKNLPPLTIAQILVWADAHYAEFRRWPTRADKDMPAAMRMAGEVSWQAIETALIREMRGLKGLPADERSLAKLLEKHRGVRNDKNLPPLTIAQILVWVDAHYAEFRRWPTRADKDMPAAMRMAGQVSWAAIDVAMKKNNGSRGISGLDEDERSLAKLVSKVRMRVLEGQQPERGQIAGGAAQGVATDPT